MLTNICLNWKVRALWTAGEIEFLEKNYLILTQTEISERLGKSQYLVRNKIKELGLNEKYQIEYAIYKGDELLFIGGKKECLKIFKWTDKTFRACLSKTGKRENGIHIVDLGRWRIVEGVE